MVSLAQPLSDAIRRAYERQGDADLLGILNDRHEERDDELADAIETDGRCRIDLGLPVELTRYLEAFPELESRPTALDAAIDMALRSIAGQTRPTDEAVQTLVENYPDLAAQIRDAAVLGHAMFSTLGARISPAPRRDLPAPFGPFTRTGFARYTLDRMLGRGSTGTVYAATDRALSEPDKPAIVAIKVLARGAADVSGFVAEASKARRVSHPNVAAVLDCGIAPSGEPYIVYEYLPGGDLQAFIQSRGLPLPPDEAAALIARISRGVHAAHMAGLVHRDLKPANVLLDNDGGPKVIDFDLAARLGDHAADLQAGNPVFVAPEQFRLDPRGVTTSADVYALGGMLFHLLTGRWPNGQSFEEIARTHDPETGRREAPSPRQTRPGIDGDLDAVCRRALHPDPARRHQSAAALADDLERWASREPIPWRRTSTSHRVFLSARRRPRTVAALLLGGVTAVAAAAFAYTSAITQAKLDQFRLDTQRADAAAAVTLGRARAMQESRDGMRAILGQMQRGFRRDNLYKMSNSLLLESYYTEFLNTPRLLADPQKAFDNWLNRTELAKAEIDRYRARGAAVTHDAAVWEYLRGFWLIEVLEPAEARSVLTEAAAHWDAILPADDPIHDRIAALRLTAHVLEFVEDPAINDLADGRRERLMELIDTAAQLRVSQGASPVHRLCLRILRRARFITPAGDPAGAPLDEAINGLHEYQDPEADAPYSPTATSRRGKSKQSPAPSPD